MLMGYLVLQNKRLQHDVVSAVTESLSQQVGSVVSIDEILWNFPNSFVLKNMYVEDHNKDTLLFVDRAKVSVNLLKLFSSTVSFRTIQFTGLEVNLSVDSTQTPNYQFFIDAFKSDNDTLSITWKMDIESAAFENCHISYNNPYKEKHIGLFNVNDMDFSDLNGYLYLRSFTQDSINLLIEDVSFKEKSGVVVDEITAGIVSNHNLLHVNRFEFKMPNTELRLSDLTVFHDDYEAFKDPVNKLRIKMFIESSHVRMSDFSAFHPQLSEMSKTISIKGGFYGLLSHFQLYDFNLQYGDATCVSGALNIKDLIPHPQNMLIDGEVSRLSSDSRELSDILRLAIGREFSLSSKLDSLGTFAYSGKITGGMSEMQTEGSVISRLGVLDLAVSFHSADSLLNQYEIKGKVKSEECRLDKMLGSKSELGNIAFDLDVFLKKETDRKFSLQAQGNVDSFYYKNYCYQNLVMNGKFDNNGFNGNLVMSDSNAEFSFNGAVDLRDANPFFHFSANVTDVNLSETHLLSDIQDAHLSFNVETNFSGKTIDDLEGYLTVDNIVFSQEDIELTVNNISLSATTHKDKRKKLSFFSDYLNGSVDGFYSFATLPKQFYNFAHHYFPALVKDEKVVDSNVHPSDFSFEFNIENMESIDEVYPLPLVIEESAKLSGFYNEKTQRFRCRLEAPLLRKGNSSWENFLFLCENPKDQLKVLCRTSILPQNKRRFPYFISIRTNTTTNDVHLDASFSSTTESTYSGKLKVDALFKDFVQGEGLTADFNINPSHVFINDTMWTIHQSNIGIEKKRIEVDSFLFDHGKQFFSLNGVNTEYSSDSIRVQFKDLNLDYFSDLIANPNISFNGVAKGDVLLFKIFKEPYFKGDLYIYDGELNECRLGDIDVNTSWIEREKCIGFNVLLLSPTPNHSLELNRSKIRGGVFLGNDSLYIGGNLKEVDMGFLRKYLKNVLQNNTGTVSGDVAAYGKFGDIGLDGTVFVKDMAFDVGYLKTSYVLSDSVKLTRHTIELNQVQVFDTDGNYAVVSGMMLHDAFRNFKFAFDLSCKNLMAMNTKEEDNGTFFGKAYVQGNGHFSGTPSIVNINLDMKTMPNTLITIPIEGTSSAKGDGFVTFIESDEKKSMAERRRKNREERKKRIEKESSSTVINLDMNVEATSDAQIHLIMDSQQGDMIKTNGNGALQFTYNTKENAFRMYGGYEIEQGSYLFTIQSILSRKFEIEKGSTVQWTGNPTNADLNIKAKYALNAPLGDIIDDPSIRTNTTNVNCLLNLKGTITKPELKFDIELPYVDEDVRSKLRSVINTEESMNRNIASLMALGHFYNMDKSPAASIATTELSSVGFSTLSSQLTNWISKINQDVSIGLNYRPQTTGTDGTVSSSEFDVALSTQFLNDRLLLNGNFGYRDEVTDAENISNSIIDFDIEYKINKSGKLRTKGFNRSNNSYFKQAPNTQGLGIIYREEFDTFGGLFKSYFNSIKNSLYRKDEKAEERNKKRSRKKRSVKEATLQDEEDLEKELQEFDDK